MFINSFLYPCFVVLVFILYWSIPKKKNVVLLVASYCFYFSFSKEYSIILFLYTLFSFYLIKEIQSLKEEKKRKLLLIALLLSSITILIVFKYLNFFLQNVYVLLSHFSLNVDPVIVKWIAPIGLSFYLLQTMGYGIDCYKQKYINMPDFCTYATFISFFPLILSGPIERGQNLIPQIKRLTSFSYDEITYGLKRIAWGYFKKLIIADSLAQYVNGVYSDININSGFVFIIVAFLYSLQIYCDFSGYSDIAIGTARLFNIKLTENFKSPYLSTSLRDFWNRWHISLSSWLRDYIYIPLGGSRKGKFRQSINLLITFLVSGLWHGAGWNYLSWGLLHASGQIVEKRKSKREDKRERFVILRIIMVFLFCMIAWIPFRVESLDSIKHILHSSFAGITSPVSYIMNGFHNLEMNKWVLLRLLLLLSIVLLFDIANRKQDVIRRISQYSVFIRWMIYIAFCELVIMNYMLYGVDSSTFIYATF